jgi:amidohydrolase
MATSAEARVSGPDGGGRACPREQALLEAIDAAAPECLALARWMGANPELSLEEHETSRRYVAHLGARDFRIECGVAGMETAFVAEWGQPAAPVRIGLLAEMDALPGIGHACGHNLSGPASQLAAEALSRVLPAEALHLVVFGSPAEETGVGKKRLVDAGYFADLDAVMMAHASDMRRAHRLFLGNRKLDFVFHGRAAHAAAYPQEGVNALDGVVALYVAIGLLRQQLGSSVRVHCIISEGGQAPNIIPERAMARVWIRALEETELEGAVGRVQACAQGAAASTGTSLEIIDAPGGSPPMWPNLPLADCYREQLGLLGLSETDHAPDENIGSSDITHVSQVVPTIHPNFPIGTGLELHTRAFSEATQSERGEQGLLEGARALALTALRLAESEPLRREVAAAARQH